MKANWFKKDKLAKRQIISQVGILVFGDCELLGYILKYQNGIPQILSSIYNTCRRKKKGDAYQNEFKPFAVFRCFVLFKLIYDEKFELAKLLIACHSQNYFKWPALEYGSDVMDVVAKHNQLDLLIFLHDNNLGGCTSDAMDLAAKYGHLRIVEFLYFNRIEGCTATALKKAKAKCHHKIVAFLHVHIAEGIPVDKYDLFVVKARRIAGITLLSEQCKYPF